LFAVRTEAHVREDLPIPNPNRSKHRSRFRVPNGDGSNSVRSDPASVHAPIHFDGRFTSIQRFTDGPAVSSAPTLQESILHHGQELGSVVPENDGADVASGRMGASADFM